MSHIQNDLETLGCAVLPEFIRPDQCAALQEESGHMAPRAYYTVETVNAYNIAIDAPLPQDHPGRIRMERGNAFVARDQIPEAAIIQRLYSDALFKHFIATCFRLTQVHEMADPLAGLCLNVVPPGKEHPWHFDTNEFTVSLLSQDWEDGGIFEYFPNIRNATEENFNDVRAVLTGQGAHQIRRLRLRPGDLQLFKGRYSLHRVNRVLGQRARHAAIFAYSEQPGVIGNAERTRQLFGRLRAEHVADRTQAVRVDQLLD